MDLWEYILLEVYATCKYCMCSYTFSEYSMDPHNVVVGYLGHDGHFFLKLLHHFLGGKPLDNLYSDSGVTHLSLVHLSKLACDIQTP